MRHRRPRPGSKGICRTNNCLAPAGKAVRPSILRFDRNGTLITDRVEHAEAAFSKNIAVPSGDEAATAGNGIGRTVRPVELREGVQLNCTAKDVTAERQGLPGGAGERL